MSLSDQLHIPAPNPDGSFAAPAPPPADSAADALRDAQARQAALAEQLDAVNELLAKPLNEILADRERFKDSAAAWDAFGAMWMLSQRAMKRVAIDLAAQLGVSEDEVVARALVHANEVLNGDGVDLGGLVAEAQLAHIARHKPLLRKQFR
ncbi:hypothetical protein QTI17_02630 [Variovorax sp. J31P179]|uniref:hypothetical protein n=1 Tax=Variovorax sp. J31P179 TaxID=3053508 RepID=UPI0025772AE5|nr:hypothetical protein [Variovorax sp. J31P179]MDM0079477.1 hypothetical protein [Variovorax sp. J31P179]